MQNTMERNLILLFSVLAFTASSGERVSTVVPVDVTGLDHEQLDAKATRYFWAGEFREALSAYQAEVAQAVAR